MNGDKQLRQAAGLQERVDDAVKAWAGVLRVDAQPAAPSAPPAKAKTSRKQRSQARHAAEKDLPLSVRKLSSWVTLLLSQPLFVTQKLHMLLSCPCYLFIVGNTLNSFLLLTWKLAVPLLCLPA